MRNKFKRGASRVVSKVAQLFRCDGDGDLWAKVV